MLAALLNQTRGTLTNLLCISGTQHHDWTADYRLYSKERLDESVLFDHVRASVLESLSPDQPLVVALDDTIIRKTGKRIHGAGWKRDPLGPAFQTNLVHAQRYLQFSAAWPLPDGEARMVPIDFQHAPTPPKPRKNAPDFDEQQKQYREALKQQNLNAVCLDRIKTLRQKVPVDRHVILNGDGSFTNKTILQNLPEGCTYLGRGRKDMALHHLPESQKNEDPIGAGRPRRYGKKAHRPEELRQDESIPWQRIRAFAAGTHHNFKVKTMGPVLWRKTGTVKPLRIVVIAPLSYRLTKGGKMLYRQPAYLVCNDLELPVEKILQYYLWRWGIEVNFREEKSLVGTGEAQVRGEASNQLLPAVTVAAYAMLWTSALVQSSGEEIGSSLKPPKWRLPSKSKPKYRPPPTGKLQRILRHEIWASSIKLSDYEDFTAPDDSNAKPEKLKMNLAANLFSTA